MVKKDIVPKHINFYERMPAHLKRTYHNPNYNIHLLTIPFRMLVCGRSGTMKTNTVLNIIHYTSGTFEEIVICCKSKSEPLYELLEASIPKEQLTFYEGIENIPLLDTFNDAGQVLCIFDDLVGEGKNQKVIEDYYKRGRKVGGGISVAYLSQGYFETPKFIRKQLNYIILKKMKGNDLDLILRDNAFGVEKADLQRMFKYATQDKLGFFLIDLEPPSDDKLFRSGYQEFLE